MAAVSLRLVRDDPLNGPSPTLAGLDPMTDRLELIEAPSEATHVCRHTARYTPPMGVLPGTHHFLNLRRGVSPDPDPGDRLLADMDRL